MSDPILFEVHAPSQEGERSSLCVRGIDFDSVSKIFLLEFGTVLTVWYVSFSISLLHLHYINKNYNAKR
jgi:hypothetical protein